MNLSIRALSLFVLPLAWTLAGCGDDVTKCGDVVTPCDDGQGGTLDDESSFSVVGTWTGTAVYDAISFDAVLTLSNNGGANGMALTGTFELKGSDVAPMTFSTGFIDIQPGDSRISDIKGADEEGYPWQLRGPFTSKRLSKGQFMSDNPKFKIPSSLFLETNLVKE